MTVLQIAHEWLRCVDEYDRKTGLLVRMRRDPQTNLIRELATEIEALHRVVAGYEQLASKRHAESDR